MSFGKPKGSLGEVNHTLRKSGSVSSGLKIINSRGNSRNRAPSASKTEKIVCAAKLKQLENYVSQV